MVSDSAAGKKETSDAIPEFDTDRVNPFVFSPPFTCCDKLTIFVNAFWLLPLRLFFFIIPSILCGGILLFICGLGNRYDPDNPTPLPKWRKTIADKVGSWIDRIFLFGFGYHWIRHRGMPADPKVAPITAVVPHSSMLDIFVLLLHGLPSFVSRENIREVFLFGSLISKTMRTIFVKRDDHDSRARAGEEIRRRAESGGQWPRVLIFPEGTTHNRKMVLQFKKGAFQPGVPIQPCLIKYQNRLGTATWCGPGVNQFKGLIYTLCQFHNPLEVEFLDVYTPSPEEVEDADLYSRNVQLLIAKKLGVPPGMQTLEDNFIMAHGRHLGLPFSSSMVVYGKVWRDLGLHAREIKNCLTRFTKMNRSKNGHLTLEDMEIFLGVPADAELHESFNSAVDLEDSQMSFRRYLYTYIGPSRSLLEDDNYMTATFRVFDSDNDGLVTSKDFYDVLSVRKMVEVCLDQQFDGRSRTRRRRSNRVHCDNHQTLSAAGTEESVTFTYDQFKDYLKINPEYLLLFQSKAKRESPVTTANECSQCNFTSVHIDIKEE